MICGKEHIKILAGHRRWLKKYNKKHLKEFNDLLYKQKSPEPAYGEAYARFFLEKSGISIKPGLDLSKKEKTPDFICQSKQNFNLEVKTMTTSKVAGKTNIPDDWGGGARMVAPISASVDLACYDKNDKFNNSKISNIIFIPIFHRYFHMGDYEAKELLIGETFFSIPVRLEKPEVATSFTKLENCIFTKLENGKITWKYEKVSAVIIGAFGPFGANIWGVINPYAVVPYDVKNTPSVRFYALKNKDAFHTGEKLVVEVIQEGFYLRFFE